MTDEFWEAFQWFTYGMFTVMIPLVAAIGWALRREAKKPRLSPLDPERVRQISAQLASLSRAVARLADQEDAAAQPAAQTQQEEVRSSA